MLTEGILLAGHVLAVLGDRAFSGVWLADGLRQVSQAGGMGEITKPHHLATQNLTFGCLGWGWWWVAVAIL